MNHIEKLIASFEKSEFSRKGSKSIKRAINAQINGTKTKKKRKDMERAFVRENKSNLGH